MVILFFNLVSSYLLFLIIHYAVWTKAVDVCARGMKWQDGSNCKEISSTTSVLTIIHGVVNLVMQRVEGNENKKVTSPLGQELSDR